MKRSNYRLEQYMKKSCHHIARLHTFSIIEEIILSKGKCTNICEAEPSERQHAKGTFLSCIDERQARHCKTSASWAFSLSQNKMLSQCYCFCLGSSWAVKNTLQVLSLEWLNTTSAFKHKASPKLLNPQYILFFWGLLIWISNFLLS